MARDLAWGGVISEDHLVRQIEEICTTIPIATIVRAVNNHDKLVAALDEAERFMEYFAEGRSEFIGPGTPQRCLEHIRSVLAEVRKEQK